MLPIPTLLEMRRRQRQQVERRAGRRLALPVALAFSLGLALLALSSAAVLYDINQNLPPLNTLPALIQPPAGQPFTPTRFLDASGEHELLRLENPAAHGHQYLPFQPSGEGGPAVLPGVLISATLRAHEPAFWQSPGATLQGLFENSHPTLAQKLVDVFLLQDEAPGLRRALRERLLAAQITAHFGHEKILEWYLNSADYGRMAFGADAAARVYFGKPAAQITLAEATLLAVVSQTPGLNPLDAPGAALERQTDLLRTLLEKGWISPEMAEAALQTEIKLNQPVSAAGDPAPAFTRLALLQASAVLGRTRLERGGLEVRTTLDYALQSQALCAARSGLQANPDDSVALDGSPCQATRALRLSLPSAATANPADIAIIISDPANGQLLALADLSAHSSSNLASLAGHPPGSILTTFIYLTALTQGYSPASLVWDIQPETGAAEPPNPDGVYRGPMRLRQALIQDRLTVISRLVLQAGPENVQRTMQLLGLSSLQLPLGQTAQKQWMESGEVSLLELSRAFGIFANAGSLAGRNLKNTPGTTAGAIEANTLLQIRSTSGTTLLDGSQPQAQPIISPQLAYLINHTLSDRSLETDPASYQGLDRLAALADGRVSGNGEIWALGYIPQRVVGVWAGSGAIMAADPAEQVQRVTTLRNSLLKTAGEGLPVAEWSMPAGISVRRVCSASGQLPGPYCPTTVDEVFLAGNEPQETDTLFRAVRINRENGLLATVFTAPAVVEEKIYLNLPPEAVAWAHSQALPMPPDMYDAILDQPRSNQAVQITTPLSFAALRGQVAIRGTAAGADFVSYRIKIGSGLDPQTWVQIGADHAQPIENGELASWDTQGLNGVYTLQLQVVREDQHIETDSIQVTIDNQAPQVQITSPSTGEFIQADAANPLILNIQARDDLTLEQVTLYIDEQLYATLTHPPYRISWTASAGQHTLKAIARDRAGNQAEALMTFTVR